MSKRASVAALVVALLCRAVSAEVSIKNGNFYIGYTDVRYITSLGLKIERVYNSKSPFLGMFGWGWGNEYETYLLPLPDGTILLHEYGGGAENVFAPELPGRINTEAALAALNSGAVAADRDYVARLRRDPDFRREELEMAIEAGRVKPAPPAAGAAFVSLQFGYQRLEKTADGYRRSLPAATQEFTESGQLRSITDTSGNWIRFEYAPATPGATRKPPIRITDTQRHVLTLSANANGRVLRIQTADGGAARYRYNNQDELVWSEDVDGHTFAYAYDEAHRHNLVAIGYDDQTTLRVDYHSRAQHENVRSIQDRNGLLTMYRYTYRDARNGEAKHDTVTVDVSDAQDKPLSSASYDYFVRSNDQRTWTERLVTTIDGERTDTTYSECCGTPIKVVKSGTTAQLTYDARGRVVTKTDNAESTRVEYDAASGKASKVTVTRPGRPTLVTSFRYDARGNPQEISDSTGRKVRLVYDGRGLVTQLTTPSVAASFTYNERSKPTRISVKGKGTMTITYRDDDEIDRVDNQGGSDLPVRISEAYVYMNDLLQRAEVTGREPAAQEH